MTVSVLNTDVTMRQIFDVAASDRADLVREMWAPLTDMYRFFPGDVDLTSMHRQSFGFDWDRVDSRLEQALKQLINANAWERIDHALNIGIDALAAANPNLRMPDLTVLLVLGDPTNEHFMNEVQGLTAFGGISGYITVTVWPTPQVLDRLEAIAVHELHHNVRYSPGGVVWNPMTVTVGEQVISEGLADEFAAELYGDRGYTHFVAERTRADNEVLAKVASGLGITGMHNFTAWVHGDASANYFGVPPIGLPTGAGYAAGTRLVRAYLGAAGSNAARSVVTPTTEILDVAAPLLGLEVKP